MIKIIKWWYEYEKWWKLFLAPIVCFIFPHILFYIGFDLSKMSNADNLAIISGFIASALAIIVTNTQLSEDWKQSIRNNPEYEHPLRIWKTPEKIFKIQKAFLIGSIFFQVALVLCTILCYQFSSWLEDINLRGVKFVFDYIGLWLFFLSSFSVINISYHSIKHVSDFDMQY